MAKKHSLNLGIWKHLKVDTVDKFVYTPAERQWLEIKYLEFKWSTKTTLLTTWLTTTDSAFSVQRI